MIARPTTWSCHDGSDDVALVRAQDTAASDGITPFLPDWVIPLQSEGTGRPVFVFPAADNEPMAIEAEGRFANHVGRDHPFWAFARDPVHYDLVHDHGVAALLDARLNS